MIIIVAMMAATSTTQAGMSFANTHLAHNTFSDQALNSHPVATAQQKIATLIRYYSAELDAAIERRQFHKAQHNLHLLSVLSPTQASHYQRLLAVKQAEYKKYPIP